jgi:branched-subunit amino acid ABC-type transport system permease component
MSNAFVIHVLFIVGVFAVIGGCVYWVMYDDVYEQKEHALGVTFGVNYTLRNRMDVYEGCKKDYKRYNCVWSLLCMEG